MTGRVGGHGGPGQGARRARSARMAGLAGRVGRHGGPGGAERARRSGPGSAVGAGLTHQDRAGPGSSSCERTHELFLEMRVHWELARGIK